MKVFVDVICPVIAFLYFTGFGFFIGSLTKKYGNLLPLKNNLLWFLFPVVPAIAVSFGPFEHIMKVVIWFLVGIFYFGIFIGFASEFIAAKFGKTVCFGLFRK